ncbi:MAG: hypothetical protein RH917_11975 [Lacipirellulaceae bacterium]
MACTHLQKLYELCQEHELRFSSSDLVRIVCKECEAEETCPSMYLDEENFDKPTEGSDE